MAFTYDEIMNGAEASAFIILKLMVSIEKRNRESSTGLRGYIADEMKSMPNEDHDVMYQSFCLVSGHEDPDDAFGIPLTAEEIAWLVVFNQFIMVKSFISESHSDNDELFMTYCEKMKEHLLEPYHRTFGKQ